MRWEKCDVCGDRRPAGEVSAWEDVHFGFCPTCGGCMGRFMRDPITKVWDAIPPHAMVGNAYYREALWGDYYCPHCGPQKERRHTHKKAN